jgi:hypothetical protein
MISATRTAFSASTLPRSAPDWECRTWLCSVLARVAGLPDHTPATGPDVERNPWHRHGAALCTRLVVAADSLANVYEHQ